MKVKVNREFRYGGEALEEGTVHDLPDSAAESAIDKGYAERAEEGVPEIEEEIPEIKEPEENEWAQLGRDLDETSQLPPKWNPERDNPPEPGKTLFGTVKRTGSGPYGQFIVVEEKDSGEKAHRMGANCFDQPDGSRQRRRQSCRKVRRAGYESTRAKVPQLFDSVQESRR